MKKHEQHSDSPYPIEGWYAYVIVIVMHVMKTLPPNGFHMESKRHNAKKIEQQALGICPTPTATICLAE
jgi:hypothetical protein